MPGKLASLGLLRGPRGPAGTAGPAGIGGAIAVATLTLARALTGLTQGQQVFVASDPDPFVMDLTSGANIVDDGETVLQVADHLLAANGRLYRIGPKVANWAALALATSGRHRTIEIQGYHTKGDGGGGVFDDITGVESASDDSGLYRVAGSRLWKRRQTGPVKGRHFGIKADGVQVIDGVRTQGNARLVSAAGKFHPGLVNCEVLITEPDPLHGEVGTMTIASTGSNRTAQGIGTDVLTALPRISGAADSYEPASGGNIFIGNAFYSAFLVLSADDEQLLIYQAATTQDEQPWYSRVQRKLTVTNYVSPTEITLSAAAPETISNIKATIGSDDTARILNCWEKTVAHGINAVDMPAGVCCITENLGMTDVHGLTIRWADSKTHGIAELRKIDEETTYPHPQFYFGAISFVECTGIRIKGGFYDANCPGLGTVHSAGGSINNSGARSGLVFYICSDCEVDSFWSGAFGDSSFGARDEHIYMQGSDKILVHRCNVVLTNNVSINANGGGNGIKIVDNWASGVLAAADSLIIARNHVTTNNHDRYEGGITVANIGHITVKENVLHDLNHYTTGTSVLDCFGGVDTDATLEIKDNTLVNINGLFGTGGGGGQGAPIRVDNHYGTVVVRGNLMKNVVSGTVNSKCLLIEGANTGKVILGPNEFSVDADSNMTIGYEIHTNVPARAVVMLPGSVFGQSIVQPWKIGAAVDTPIDLGEMLRGEDLRMVSGLVTILTYDQVSTFTADATSNYCTSTGDFTPINGDELILTTSGAIPGGLALLKKFYARDIAGGGAGTFKLAATRGGAAIDITTAGSGVHTFTHQGGNRYVIPEGSITQNSIVVLAGEDILSPDTGEVVRIERRDTSVYTVEVRSLDDEGDILYEFPASIKGAADFRFDDGGAWDFSGKVRIH